MGRSGRDGDRIGGAGEVRADAPDADAAAEFPLVDESEGVPPADPSGFGDGHEPHSSLEQPPEVTPSPE